MKKKLLTTLVLLTIVCSCVFVFVACDSNKDIIGDWSAFGSKLSIKTDGTATGDLLPSNVTWTYNKETKTCTFLSNDKEFGTATLSKDKDTLTFVGLSFLRVK